MQTIPKTGVAEVGPSRRTTIKRGIAVGGAAIWAIPAVQALSVTSASAQGTSVVPPPLPPPPVVGLPSHGFAIINCGSGAFVVKIDSGSLGSVSSIGNQDRDYLATQQNLVLGTDYRQPTPTDLAPFAAFGAFGSTMYNALPALYITLPGGCGFVNGFTYVFDGSFSGGGTSCGDGDKYTRAQVEGSTVYFSVYCNDVVAAPGE